MIRKRLSFLPAMALCFCSCSLFMEDPTTLPTFYEGMEVSDVTETSAHFFSSYIINSYGTQNIVEVGFMYSTDPKFDTENSVFDSFSGGYGYINFETTVSDLQPATTYYVCLYAKNDNGRIFKAKQHVQFTTHPRGDYSSAKVQVTEGDDLLSMQLLSCIRDTTQVLIELAITNIGSAQDEYFGVVNIGSSFSVYGQTYISYIEDTEWTTYTANEVSYYLGGNKVNRYSSEIPFGSTERMYVVIEDVPLTVNRISAHLGVYFNGSPLQYAYFELLNVPIY